MLNIDIFISLDSNQGDVTADLLHSNLVEGKKIYVYLTKVFEQY